jgi:hypothetical protein
MKTKSTKEINKDHKEKLKAKGCRQISLWLSPEQQNALLVGTKEATLSKALLKLTNLLVDKTKTKSG